MIIALAVNTYYLQKNLKEIESLATFICEVEVLRLGERIKISSKDLVPGDIMYITEKITFPCDLILLKGFCLVNETMLTGESQPVMKEALPEINDIYNRDKLYTLSAGTKVVVTNKEALGFVIATGYRTAKGDLIRSILFPRPNRFKFERDAYYFVMMMGIMTLIGFFASIKPFNEGGYDAREIIISLLDLITIAVPPALPLTMSIGIGYSMKRLKDNKISCIQPPAIQAAGRINIACFDKTGTLTQDEMNLNMVYDSEKNLEIHDLNEADLTFQKCLASCHSLTVHEDIIIGDPQEIAIINSLG